MEWIIKKVEIYGGIFIINSWKMDEFTAQEIHEKEQNKKIVVPKYQRGIVWKDSQKKELIDSIKKGIPFGSILL